MRNNTKHWMASDLGEQASFFVNRTGRFTKSGVEIVQSYLQIKQVQSKDQGFYRCRVDFFQAPTRNVKVKLSLIGMKNCEKLTNLLYVSNHANSLLSLDVVLFFCFVFHQNCLVCQISRIVKGLKFLPILPLIT